MLISGIMLFEFFGRVPKWAKFCIPKTKLALMRHGFIRFVCSVLAEREVDGNEMEIARLCALAICGCFADRHTSRHLHGGYWPATFRILFNVLAFSLAARFRSHIVFSGQIFHSKEPSVLLNSLLAPFVWYEGGQLAKLSTRCCMIKLPSKDILCISERPYPKVLTIAFGLLAGTNPGTCGCLFLVQITLFPSPP